MKLIPVDAIKIPDFLPTRTLISHERLSEIRDSIKKHGLKYPIKVRRINTDYELIDGYLRLKSVQALGWKGILAEIKDATDQEVIVESVITNKHRIEEDPITLAKKLDILVNAFGYTQEKLAEEIGISQEYISNGIRLLKLPTEIQREIAIGNIGFRHGLTLLTVNNVDLQKRLANEITDRNLTIPQLEERIRELQPKPEPVSGGAQAPSQTEAQEGFEPSAQARTAVQPERGGSESIPNEDVEGSESIPQEESKPEPAEPLLTGFEWTCPECGKKLIINHVDYPNSPMKDHHLEACGSES